MKKLHSLILLMLLTSCGPQVYKSESGYFVCHVSAWMKNETYVYETLKEATKKCEYYGEIKKKRRRR